MEEHKKIIEINGIKMEVDLRNAKVIDEYKVGDNIKVLIKEYGESFKSHIGTIIGFDDFKNKPTVVIAYLKTAYSTATIEYVYFNDTTKDIEICPLNDWDLPVTKQQVLDQFDHEIEAAQKKIDETEQKKKLFEQLFGKYFEKADVGISPADQSDIGEDLPFG